ncbi:MAG: RNA polymerase sigma factor [Myxococcales bacterium]|nr:MAG: RNA polymerase sigma factor [Myxococcales bacterium]
MIFVGGLVEGRSAPATYPDVRASTALIEGAPEAGVRGEGAPFLSARDFEQLYAGYFHHVTRWVRALGCPAADLDDLAQETFLIARRRLSQFEGGNTAGWLYRIAQNVTRSHRRKVWLRRALHLDPELSPSRATEPSPVEAYERRESRRQIQLILSKMTERRRVAFFLFEVEGYSCEEIAQLEGVALNTIYTRLHHARRDFMTLLAQAEGSEPAP